MPRPRIAKDGTIVDPKDLRKLWVIYNPNNKPDVSNMVAGYYVSRYGIWTGLEQEAAAFNTREEAEDATAALILCEPQKYFGKVEVREILG